MKHPTRKKGDARRQRQRLLLLHFNFSVWRSEKLRPFENALGWAEIDYKRAKDPDEKTRARTRAGLRRLKPRLLRALNLHWDFT